MNNINNFIKFAKQTQTISPNKLKQMATFGHTTFITNKSRVTNDLYKLIMGIYKDGSTINNTSPAPITKDTTKIVLSNPLNWNYIVAYISSKDLVTKTEAAKQMTIAINQVKSSEQPSTIAILSEEPKPELKEPEEVQKREPEEVQEKESEENIEEELKETEEELKEPELEESDKDKILKLINELIDSNASDLTEEEKDQLINATLKSLEQTGDKEKVIELVQELVNTRADDLSPEEKEELTNNILEQLEQSGGKKKIKKKTNKKRTKKTKHLLQGIII